MNIFVLDYDVEKSAQYHCDKHVVKMVLEQTQIICTVLNEKGYDTPYKSTHSNHPCVKWAKENSENLRYLVTSTKFLLKEYTHRYGKRHKCEDVIDLICSRIPNLTLKLDLEGITPFAQAMPYKYKNPDAVLAYRNYYCGEKQRMLSWKNRSIPSWVVLTTEKESI